MVYKKVNKGRPVALERAAWLFRGLREGRREPDCHSGVYEPVFIGEGHGDLRVCRVQEPSRSSRPAARLLTTLPLCQQLSIEGVGEDAKELPPSTKAGQGHLILESISG